MWVKDMTKEKNTDHFIEELANSLFQFHTLKKWFEENIIHKKISCTDFSDVLSSALVLLQEMESRAWDDHIRENGGDSHG